MNAHLVTVDAYTLGLPAGQDPSDWYARCSCGWFGSSRATIRAARNDAARHRKATHQAVAQ